MVNSMTATFFSQELQGDGQDRLLGAMIYPEMSIMGSGR
jgi:hypothetical protein